MLFDPFFLLAYEGVIKLVTATINRTIRDFQEWLYLGNPEFRNVASQWIAPFGWPAENYARKQAEQKTWLKIATEHAIVPFAVVRCDLSVSQWPDSRKMLETLRIYFLHNFTV